MNTSKAQEALFDKHREALNAMAEVIKAAPASETLVARSIYKAHNSSALGFKRAQYMVDYGVPAETAIAEVRKSGPTQEAIERSKAAKKKEYHDRLYGLVEYLKGLPADRALWPTPTKIIEENGVGRLSYQRAVYMLDNNATAEEAIKKILHKDSAKRSTESWSSEALFGGFSLYWLTQSWGAV
ncbi:hypothetical protein [Neptuniibacter sp.]|uniref:hypothetical protein n=1 Tax=Neptuniibacter sp. TaxID=1962643 RepID=UPI002601C549|nr:hypothetical protein [Neptuniibacter sp.]MCP4596159.1 hypothetical protein [Neptuniibacter sp.]